MLPAGLQEQLLYCGRFALLGLALGVFYDVLRAIRVSFRLRRWGTAMLDVLFCLTALTGFLLMLLQGTDGRLRGFLLFGLATGFFGYRKLISLQVLKVFLQILRLLRGAAHLFWETFLWLFSFPRGN